MNTLRTTLELIVDQKFDAYTVMAKSPLFVKYPKTVAGLVSFWNEELQPSNFLATIDSIILTYDNGTVISPVPQFLLIILLPLYHCQWDDETKALIELALLGMSHPKLTELGRCMFQNKPSVTIEMIPSDWRDLVEAMITEGKLDLSKFKTIDEVEKAVDTDLYSVPDTTVPEAQLPPSARMMIEDKEILARTLGLSVNEFNTKGEALGLYEARRRG